MPVRYPAALICAVAFLSANLGTSTAFAQTEQQGVLPTRVVQVIRDSDSAYFDELIEGLSRQLEQLAEGRYQVEIRDDMNAGGDFAQVAMLLDRALADRSVDAIFAAGVAATSTATRLSSARRIKPIVGGAIEFSDLDDALLGPAGASTLENYTFVRSPRRIAADLEMLARLVDTRRIHALVNSAVLDFFGADLQRRVQRLEARLDLEIELVPGADTADETLSALPESVDAIYVSVLVANEANERRKLFEGLTDRRIPTLSMKGVRDVEIGALATIAPDNSSAVERRMALNLHQLLNGVPTELLPVTLQTQDRLILNMKTARQIGWSPDYDTSLAAVFIERDAFDPRAEPLSLEGAIERASKRNPSVLIEDARQLQDQLQINILRSSYRPQLSIAGNAFYRGVGDPITPALTPHHAEQVSLGAEVSQLLYSNRLSRQIDAQRMSARASEFELESARLDVMETAGQAFLEVLLTEALHRIERENLQLIENNLQLAKLRREIGSAEALEVFRWESSRAQVRASLIQRDSDRRNARVQLNVALGEPRTKRYELVDIQLDDDQFYYLEGDLLSTIRNDREFEDFLEFVRMSAADRAPEIHAFERLLSAQGVLLEERKRRNYLPEVSLTAGYDRVLQDSSAIDRDSQNEWFIGVGFEIPLFEGGRRKPEIAQLRATVSELTAQRDSALYLIEQRSLAAGYGIMASHPNMRLSREARRAAERNYASVQTKYSQGSATIIDLLDAQTELLNQWQSEAIAGYRYLQDVVSLQRVTAWFEFEKTSEERTAWISEIRRFIESKARERNRPR